MSCWTKFQQEEHWLCLYVRFRLTKKYKKFLQISMRYDLIILRQHHSMWLEFSKRIYDVNENVEHLDWTDYYTNEIEMSPILECLFISRTEAKRSAVQTNKRFSLINNRTIELERSRFLMSPPSLSILLSFFCLKQQNNRSFGYTYHFIAFIHFTNY